MKAIIFAVLIAAVFATGYYSPYRTNRLLLRPGNNHQFNFACGGYNNNVFSPLWDNGLNYNYSFTGLPNWIKVNGSSLYGIPPAGTYGNFPFNVGWNGPLSRGNRRYVFSAGLPNLLSGIPLIGDLANLFVNFFDGVFNGGNFVRQPNAYTLMLPVRLPDGSWSNGLNLPNNLLSSFRIPDSNWDWTFPDINVNVPGVNVPGVGLNVNVPGVNVRVPGYYGYQSLPSLRFNNYGLPLLGGAINAATNAAVNVATNAAANAAANVGAAINAATNSAVNAAIVGGINLAKIPSLAIPALTSPICVNAPNFSGRGPISYLHNDYAIINNRVIRWTNCSRQTCRNRVDFRLRDPVSYNCYFDGENYWARQLSCL